MVGLVEFELETTNALRVGVLRVFLQVSVALRIGDHFVIIVMRALNRSAE
jgi:hypothetical protein